MHGSDWDHLVLDAYWEHRKFTDGTEDSEWVVWLPVNMENPGWSKDGSRRSSMRDESTGMKQSLDLASASGWELVTSLPMPWNTYSDDGYQAWVQLVFRRSGDWGIENDG